ncbi:MAG: hypothetical protein J7L38_03770 [Thermoproteales archaeon]|nr:hypothetical protein [Thermoproteales archaeon]
MDSRIKGYIAVFTAANVWTLGTVAIKYLSRCFNIVSQSFFRYLSAAVVLYKNGARKPPTLVGR